MTRLPLGKHFGDDRGDRHLDLFLTIDVALALGRRRRGRCPASSVEGCDDDDEEPLRG